MTNGSDAISALTAVSDVSERGRASASASAVARPMTDMSSEAKL